MNADIKPITDAYRHADPCADWIVEAARRARAASMQLAASARHPASAGQRDAWLTTAAKMLRQHRHDVAAANAADLEAYRGTPALRDRLLLDEARIDAMARGLETVAALPDPLARTLAEWTQPNGLTFRRIAAPLGVIGMIYESRPNVGADAAALCIKSGNAVILRGGSESARSAQAIHAVLAGALREAGLPEAALQIVPSTDRGHVAAMLAAAGAIDLIVPRGGQALVERVQREARVPVLAHASGLCHTYVHAAAEPAMARRILADAKMRRTSVCGATETLLIDAGIAATLLPSLVADLTALGCAFRADTRAQAIVPTLPAASPADFDTEWLDATLSIAVVDGVDAALAHIARHGSGHTDAIITANAAAAEHFLAASDAAVTLWNASTQFSDGGEFGFGAELGIATGRVHARGPIGLEQLTSYRYVVLGDGQVRG